MKHRHNNQRGPIPLDLEHEDRRWLSNEARALGVRPSELCAYLVRAARKSGLSAKDAGRALASVAQPEPEPPARQGAVEALMADLDGEAVDEPEPRDVRPVNALAAYSEIDRALVSLQDTRNLTPQEVRALVQKKMDEDFQRELNKTDAQIEAEQAQAAAEHARIVRRPRPQPTLMPSRHGYGARKDIVQLYPPGSLTEPAGLNDRLSSKNDDEANIEVIKSNFGHLRAG